ncbi:MAG: nitroreductase family protein [Myxococcales bacterium]
MPVSAVEARLQKRPCEDGAPIDAMDVMGPMDREGAMSAALHATTESCKGCGVCVEVCPNRCLKLSEKRAVTDEVRGRRCIRCGHCVLACPNGSLSIEGLGNEDLLSVPPSGVGYAELSAFLLARRSMRRFKDEPVDRETLLKVLEAASVAPMGIPPHTTEILVLDQRAELDHLAAGLRAVYADLLKAWRNPVARQFVRLSAGAEKFHALRTHVVEIVEDANARFAATGEDRYTYRAPVAMLFHANRWDLAFRTNAVLAATYAMLAAQSLGLGSILLDLVGPAVNRSAELRQRWSIPKDNEVVITLMLGHSKTKFARALKRRLKGVRFAGEPNA